MESSSQRKRHCTITATTNGITDTVEVNIYNYDPTIKLSQSKYDFYTKKGNTLTLKATVDGPSKTVAWERTDTTAATVNTKGKMSAVGEGETVITATANEVSAECVIMVKESAVHLARSGITIPVAAKKNGEADIKVPANGITAVCHVVVAECEHSYYESGC